MNSLPPPAKNESEDSTSRISKKEIKRIFRTGNKLLAKAVNYVTYPLRDCNGHIARFESWLEDQPKRIYRYTLTKHSIPRKCKLWENITDLKLKVETVNGGLNQIWIEL